MVNVLIVGSGGREHAIGWKISQSDNVHTVFHAPGNGGTLNNIPISVDNLEELSTFASENDCFTIVGPEAPLAAGIVDIFNEKGLKIFGPTKKASQLESSKIWAKEFMKRNDIPTAAFEVFHDPSKAKEYVNEIEHDVVIKADGLAAGKGVVVCNNKNEAEKAIDMMLINKKFGDAGNNIIIEERMDGIEASYIALSDGGIMLKDGEPFVLEYNVRMGDPECQPIIMRMNSDLFQYLNSSVDGTLEKLSPISWKNKSAVCVVLASKGYPESYPKEDEISGLENIFSDAYIFHAGTKKQNKKIITNGGRVLGITALGDTLESAIKNAYDVTEKISWKNKYSRTDIGKKGLKHLTES